MGASAFAFAIAIAVGGVGQTIPAKQIEAQSEFFRRSWDTDLVWKFDELPAQGSVDKSRLPYSGYIYPDTGGGTASALRKYDAAFNGRRYQATRHEQWDTSAFQETTYETRRGGLFGLRVQSVPVTRTPYWHGHCNGWTSATIRHPEPKNTVIRNGVKFTPVDVKALLAEIYLYTDIEFLAGEYGLVDAGSLHVILTNWIGRQRHPVAMEATPGREKWNFPIYAYSTSSAQRGSHKMEVKMHVRYAHYADREYQKGPLIARQKYFHYSLDLNADGEIVGGGFYRDSSRIDLLWMPLPPIQGGQEGNERGNPYVDVDEVVAIWRDSVDDETVGQWANIRRPQDEPEAATDQVTAADPSASTAEEAIAAGAETADGPAGENGVGATTLNTAGGSDATEEPAAGTNAPETRGGGSTPPAVSEGDPGGGAS